MKKQPYIFKKQLVTLSLLLLLFSLCVKYDVTYEYKLSLLIYFNIVMGLTFLPSLPRILKYPYCLHVFLFDIPLVLPFFFVPWEKNLFISFSEKINVMIISLVAVIILLFVGRRYYLSKVNSKFEMHLNFIEYLVEIFRVFYQCVAEEICFRGFFVGYLRSELGIWSIIVSAFLFVIMHYLNRWANKKFNIKIYICQFLLGIILGCSYYITQSLLIVIVCHLVFNSSEIIYLSKRMFKKQKIKETYFDDY